MKASKVIGCAGALLLLAGCVENQVSLEFVGAKPFEIEVQEIEGVDYYFCVMPDIGEETMRSQGWIDFENNQYTLVHPFEFRNNVHPADTDVGRLDTANITLERMVVSYRGLPGQDHITAALDGLDTAVYMSAHIPSGGGGLMAPLTIIPSFRGRAIQSAVVPSPGDVETIIASFYLEGKLGSGASVSTATIDFPVTVGFESGVCEGLRCLCYVEGE